MPESLELGWLREEVRVVETLDVRLAEVEG